VTMPGTSSSVAGKNMRLLHNVFVPCGSRWSPS
jgi:hypothetical protein